MAMRLQLGFQLVWLSLDEAIEVLGNDKPINYDGKFIQKRDLIFLKETSILHNKV